MKKFLFITCIFLFLCKISINSQEKLIKNGDEWKYFDNGNLTTDWYKNTSFQKWRNGITPIGYGDRKIITDISFGGDKENKQITKYFSKNFVIENKNDFVAFEFRLQRDDGAVVYVNGKELYRENMPEGFTNAETRAIEFVEKEEESVFNSKMFESDIFKVGLNTVSVEVHQSSARSSDLIFSLEVVGHIDKHILEDILSSKNIENLALQNKVTSLTSNLALEKLNFKIQNLENSNYSLKFIIFIVSFLMVVLFFIAVYLVNSSKRKEIKLENKLEKEIESKKNREKEIIELSTHLLHNKQYFKEIKADIKGIDTKDKSVLKSINFQIDEILDSDKDWENLKKHFNSVHNGFYDKLLEKHPDLTEVELRHCMFIKMYLQTKEIASILLIDPRSVQTARYRIKKKLQLDEETDLREYLLSI